MLNKAMQEWMPNFENARLTLEVENFTTKDLNSVAEILEKEPAEQNFYASMFHNNIHVAGSDKVYKKFMDIIKDYIDGRVKTDKPFILADLTHKQYLSETDKGSIMVIKHLDKLKDVLTACGPYLVSYVESWSGEEAMQTFCKTTHHTEREWYKYKDEKKEMWVTSIRVFYKLIAAKMKHEDGKDGMVPLAQDIVNEESVEKALKVLMKQKVFPSLNDNPVGLLVRVSKVLKGIADDEILTFVGSHRIGYHPYDPEIAKHNFCQIGSTLALNLNWRFNIKYVGCRLSDWFDSVPFEEYVKWNKEGTNKATYDAAKKIAVAVNNFALALQTAIYLQCVYNGNYNEAAVAASHSNIDNLYARVSMNDFFGLMVLSTKDRANGGSFDIRESIKALTTGLDSVKDLPDVVPDSLQTKIGYVITQGQIVYDAIALPATKIEPKEKNKNVKGPVPPEVERTPGFAFFKTIFDLVDATANSLPPNAEKKKSKKKEKGDPKNKEEEKEEPKNKGKEEPKKNKRKEKG